MDARVWKPRREYAHRRFEALKVTAAQARAERAALRVVLAKCDDRLLDDVGLTRAKGERLVSRYAVLGNFPTKMLGLLFPKKVAGSKRGPACKGL